MNNFYQLRLEYFGTHYFGWQIQKNEKTIQGELDKAITRAFPKSLFKTLGASRTDRGVHALDQLCKLSIDCHVPEKNLLKAINDQLPEDILIKNVSQTSKEFHPIYSVEKKTYLYLFSSGIFSSGIYENLYSYWEQNDLDIEKMNEAANLFVGEHDFVNFYTLGSDVSTTKRKIYSSGIMRLKENEFPIKFSSEIYALKITGNGFLKQMIRLIMGALVEVGKGNIELMEIEQSLKEKLPRKLSKVLDPRGLYLQNIKLKD